MEIVELMGSSLLTEEVYFLGFLPLKSYIDSKKHYGAGTKCPPEKEDLVRALILKDALEKLCCTYSNIVRRDKKIEE